MKDKRISEALKECLDFYVDKIILNFFFSYMYVTSFPEYMSIFMF